VRDVAAASDLPVCLYNNPGTTHFTMSAELVIELSRIENVKAVKNPATRDHATAAAQMAQLRENVPAGFVLGYSGDALINNPLKADADAWYSVIAGTLPDLTLSIWNTRGDAAAVDAAHSKAAPLWALFNAHGGIRVVPEILNLMGLGPVVLPKPLLPLPNAIVAEIEAALDILSTTGAAA
jgi:4-hydroxy-tetrahydrodipicolinate synthase